jgi:peptidoglycan hydrolase CwlO-like protein
MKPSKILSFLKNTFEWIVALALLLSGYLIFKFIKDYFFGNTSNEEKELLNEIKENEKKIEQLEQQADNNMEREEELAKKKEEIQNKIDKLKEEYYKKQKEFKKREEEIKHSTHKNNINYINEKYKNRKDR